MVKGDTERVPNACNCWQRLDYIKASSLYEDGYRYVGTLLVDLLQNRLCMIEKLIHN